MAKTYKIVFTIVLIILLFLIGFGGYLLYKNKNTLKNLLPKGLPGLQELGKINLPGTLYGPKSAQKAENLDPDQVIYWTNKYRQDNGLQPLTRNAMLTKAASEKVDDMFKKQYFEHNSPDNTTPAELVLSAGYKYKVTGENLALGDFKDEKDLVDAWMNSPGHRANILNSGYTEIGVATGLNTFQDRGQTWLAVQEFGDPAPNCASPDTSLLNNINSKKAEYENLVSQINSLTNQANTDIQKGNDIYAKTHDRSQAQSYWDEGTQLRSQAQQLQTQANNLYDEITSESNQYNSQVNSYNQCIK